MPTIFSKPPRGEIVNPHVFVDVPDPKRAWIRKLSEQRTARSEYYEMGALIQLLNWCTEELRRRNASQVPTGAPTDG